MPEDNNQPPYSSNKILKIITKLPDIYKLSGHKA